MSFETLQPADGQSVADIQLDLMRMHLSNRTYPGYPEFSDRLFSDPSDLEYDANGRVILPDGPWNVDTHPNRRDTEAVPTPEKQAELLEQGYLLDSKGRPLHPWFLKMIADPLIGVTLGKGFNWEWAANRTADGVVIKNDRLLVVKRADTGQWALPGGFINRGELEIDAAKREIMEETGLVVPDTAKVIPAYQGPLAGIRTTAHSWHETSAFVFDLGGDGPLPKVEGADDAVEADWMPLESFEGEGVVLFGAHPFLLTHGLGSLSLSRSLDT